MQKLLLLIVSLMGASALVVGPLAPAHVARAASPTMACNGGKGGKGGKTPPKDKWLFRPKVNKLVQEADSAEGVKDILLTASTEKLLLKMNWKYRRSAGHKIRKRAAQFGVEVPHEFAAFHVRPRNTPKHLLVPSIAE
mmetsp:Transcript_62531/g.165981  ORF Transcript_62531/g.165981 Transcript_62531/m.165981 type:complete len:138 (-) Transcript_62531:103-516(-)